MPLPRTAEHPSARLLPRGQEDSARRLRRVPGPRGPSPGPGTRSVPSTTSRAGAEVPVVIYWGWVRVRTIPGPRHFRNLALFHVSGTVAARSLSASLFSCKRYTWATCPPCCPCCRFQEPRLSGKPETGPVGKGMQMQDRPLLGFDRLDGGGTILPGWR